MFLVHAINDAIKRKTEAPSCAEAGSQIPAFCPQQGGLGMRFLGFQGEKSIQMQALPENLQFLGLRRR